MAVTPLTWQRTERALDAAARRWQRTQRALGAAMPTAARRCRDAEGALGVAVPAAARRLGREATSADAALFEAVAGLRAPRLDRTMRRLTRSADHAKLWLALAAAMRTLGGERGRRACRRGLASLVLASALANLVAKPLAPRRRPVREVTDRGRHVRVPFTSSFPSGHAASAFGFAAGAGAELPALRPPLLALATAVAYSRVHTGVHYPADVIAGAAVGTAASRLTG